MEQTLSRFLLGSLLLLLAAVRTQAAGVDLLMPDGPEKTVRLRLKVTLAGQPLEQKEGTFLRAWFRFCDPKDTGQLDPAAIRRALRHNPLRRLFSTLELTPPDLGLLPDQSASIDDLVLRYQRQPQGRFLMLEASRSVPPYAGLLTQAIGRALDRDGDGRLSRVEVEGAEQALLAAFDIDGDDCLTALEIVPDLLTTAPPGPTTPLARPLGLSIAEGEPTFEVRIEAGQASPHWRRRQGGLSFDLLVVPAEPPAFTNVVKLFQTADAENRGYVVVKDLETRNLAPLRQLHAAADRDGDGKLTREELTAYLALCDQAAQGADTLAAAPQPRGWFETLDCNRDGRLGVRELRRAWDVLAEEQDRQRGYIELPNPNQTGFSLTLFRGPAPVPGVILSPLPGRSLATASGRGPAWFQHLDRNGDGDVSWREFIGGRELFRFYDRDGDGLISAEEAEFGDALRKEKKP